jgi:hypothetical protein
LSHLSSGDFGGAEFLDVMFVRGTAARRDELVDRTAKRFGFRIPKHLLRRGIEQNNVLLFVDGDHSAQRGMNDGGKPGFTAFDLFFNKAPPGDVLQYPVPQYVAVSLLLRHGAAFNPNYPLVWVKDAELTGPHHQAFCGQLHRSPELG